jgi:archaellum biogenesis ATPase FlaH
VAVGHSIQVLVPDTKSHKGFEDFVLKDLTKRDAEKEIAAERAEEAAARNETKLRIAWQYEKYSAKKDANTQVQSTAQRPALGMSNTFIRTKSPWCHHFDISKAPDKSVVEDKIRQNTNASIEKIQTGEGRVVGQIVKKVQDFIESLSKTNTTASQTIGRIVIPELGGLAWDSLDPRRLLNLLVHLRYMAQQSSRVSIVITVPIHQLETSDASRVRHVADSYIELEAVEDISQVVKLSTDSRTVAGHLEIYKLAAFGAIKSSRPQITSYSIRNKRKRLYIQPVEVDPDAEMQPHQDAQQPKNPLDF